MGAALLTRLDVKTDQNFYKSQAAGIIEFPELLDALYVSKTSLMKEATKKFPR